jgi:hypothetical protein
MVALPCGSRSITSTRWSTRASPAARLTVVVVLPTPPFWFAMQKTFAMGSKYRRCARRHSEHAPGLALLSGAAVGPQPHEAALGGEVGHPQLFHVEHG